MKDARIVLPIVPDGPFSNEYSLDFRHRFLSLNRDAYSMKPHSLGTITPQNPFAGQSRADRLKSLGWVGRHQGAGKWPKGTVLPETQVAACPKVKVIDLPEGFLKQNHIEHLEQNQKIAGCCRHPENHEVEARKSHPDEIAPDIYIFYCKCGRKHRFFCVGMDDVRPTWKV